MLSERLGKELLFLDGGMGTLLQERGLLPGELPESWNIERKEEIIRIHQSYFEAGSDIVLTNTFGANAIKYRSQTHTLREVIFEAVSNVKEAARRGVKDERTVYTALDVGPTGKLLEPLGDLGFEEAYEAFREVAACGAEAGADVIHIETMSDTYEVKAAVLAAKETGLLVFATLIFDEKGKLLTGGDIPSAVALLEGLGVDAVGLNCGMGPGQMLPLLRELLEYASVPVIVKPNAGLPKTREGRTYYDVLPEAFAETVREMAEAGACIVGGCCGTTPEHIRALTGLCRGMQPVPTVKKDRTLVSSYGKCVEIGRKPVIIGERINPTGKKRFRQALQERDFDYLLKEGIEQEERGAHILDVNVGVPGLPEASVMEEAVTRLQSVTSLPLQIDTVLPEALERAMRVYNGKPMVNSVNGKQESMDTVFPLVKKYGAVVVALTIDENGIPDTAEGRLRIAEKIIAKAAAYGIDRKDIVVDVLAMTISSEPEGARTTLEALRLVREKCGVHTVLGVSNISFGLPNRPLVNAHFYAMAMQQGLGAAIVNPCSGAMMDAYDAFCALMNYDENCASYIERHSPSEGAAQTRGNGMQREVRASDLSLKTAVERGLKDDAARLTEMLLGEEAPLPIIDRYLIPALDVVGKGFESGEIFLPQLLMSAEAAKAAFAVLKRAMADSGGSQRKLGKIVLATVKGDIHDIGKNIVKVLLENYSFEVLDLGKDVPPEKVVAAVKREDIRLVGLSALMTTTVVNMEETIRLLKAECPACRVMVGGAVLNQEYASQIGADFYGKDAMQSVHYAQQLFR